MSEHTLAATAMRHAELIDKLGELYTLLAQLGSVDPPSLVTIPTPDAPAPILRPAALEAGYTQEVVDLMQVLPYVSKDANVGHPELRGSTEPIDFTKCEKEDDFKIWREFDDGLDHEGDDGNEDLIPGTVLKLTEHHLYGHTLLYDTESAMLIDWESFENPDDVEGYAHVPPKTPAAVLDPWIEAYRTFKYMHTPGGNLWDPEHSVYAAPEPPAHYEPGAKTHWWAAWAVEQARRNIKDLYLENGWDVTSKTQDGFDRAKFMERRARYMDEVVRPLEEKADEAWKEWHEHRDEL